MSDKKNFQTKIVELSKRFELGSSEMRSRGFDEATLRLEYLDPLFAALGWNIWNTPPQPLHLRDVVVENRTEEMKGRTGRVDYLFRTSGLDRWICEAKKPFDNINRHAFQVQNYTYNMRLWVGVLADFENFNVYVVGGRPTKDRPFSPAPGWRLHYSNYEALHSKIWDLFSREAVENGSLELFVQSLGKVGGRSKQGWLIKPDRTKQVDEAFLSFLEDQRALFARDIVKKNPKIAWTGVLLADCLQAIFDRILFQRVSEDRGIDVGVQLQKLVTSWEGRGRIAGQLWPTLVGNFRHLATTFNGGVFGKGAKSPHLVDGLTISDALLEDFIEEIAGDTSEWLFGTMPLSVIGSVYERFLGSTVDAKGNVERKPHARKAGGVYYTPEPVVRQVVDRTIGPLLLGKSPDEILKLKVIDPSCGSGSFLLVVFERLLQHCLDWFQNNPVESSRSNVFEQSGRLWLTTSFKRRLLKSCIFGVDLDPVAVQVAQMSLCLKVLEDETQEALANERRLFPKDTFLPDLEENIIHANSLVPVSAFPKLINEEYLVKGNVVDWGALLAKTNRRSGFDAVVGNPPWGADLDSVSAEVARELHRPVIVRMTDTYIYFTHLSIETLLKKSGYMGLVLPGTLLNQSDAYALRAYLLDNGVEAVSNLGQGIFQGALNTTCAIIARKGGPQTSEVFLNDIGDVPLESRELVVGKWNKFPREEWEGAVRSDPSSTFFTKNIAQAASMASVRARLGTLADSIDAFGIQRGVTPDYLRAHLIDPKDAKKFRIEASVLKKSLRGEDIKAFRSAKSTVELIYTSSNTDLKSIPNTIAYMRQFKPHIKCSEVIEKKHPWWRLHRPRKAELFARPKVIGLTTSRRIELVYDPSGELFVTDAMYVFGVADGIPIEFVFGIMQSSTFLKFYQLANQGDGRVIPQIKATKLMDVPFPEWDSMDDLHQSIVTVTKALMALAESTAVGAERSFVAQRRELDRVAALIFGENDEASDPASPLG